MKKYIYFLALIAIFSIGCQDDDVSFDPLVLQHDGANATAPALPIGVYEAAVHFNSNDVQLHPNTELIALEYYIQERPAYAEIRLSSSNGGNVPGNIFFSREVTNLIEPFGWNRFDLGTPQQLNNGLWISLYFENDVEFLRTMGCDGGPAVTNGDWLYDDFDGQWLTYQGRTGESINWNIRGILQDR